MEIGIEVYEAQCASSSPKANVISSSLGQLAGSCLLQNMKILQRPEYAMLACDKANKDSLPHFVKTLSCWDDIKDEVECFLLDIDGAGSSDQNCADAMNHSMLQKQVGMILLGIGTDSGGGATLESFCDALSELKLISPTFCFISVCTLHLPQLLLAVPVDHVFGLGGRDKYNVMQLLHSMYDLERFFGQGVGKTMYQEHVEKL